MTRDELIISHQKDAERVASSFWRKGGMRFDLEELCAEALVCLVKAADEYDPSRQEGPIDLRRAKSAFGPFLGQRIKWHLIRYADLQTGGARENILVREGKKQRVKMVGLTISRQGKNQDEEVERSLPDTKPTVEDDLVSDHQRQIVRRLFTTKAGSSWQCRNLTRSQRAVGRLTFRDGLNLDSVAECLGLSRHVTDVHLRAVVAAIKKSVSGKRGNLPAFRSKGEWFKETCEWCAEPFRYRSPSLRGGAPRYPRTYCSRKCIAERCHEGRRKLPMNADRLRELYIDRKMTVIQIGTLFKCAHRSVSKMLANHGIPRRPRHHISDGLCKQCGEPAVRKKNGAAMSRLCRKHQTEYQTEWARRRRANEPGIGCRPLGRKRKPRACPRCGIECDGTREALAHCPSEVRQERARRGWITRKQCAALKTNRPAPAVERAGR